MLNRERMYPAAILRCHSSVMERFSEVIASHATPTEDSKHSLAQADMSGKAMVQPWKQLEGQVVGGKFRLLQHLAGSDQSAVFLTERTGEPRKAAIKLLATQPENAARHL